MARHVTIELILNNLNQPGKRFPFFNMNNNNSHNLRQEDDSPTKFEVIKWCLNVHHTFWDIVRFQTINKVNKLLLHVHDSFTVAGLHFLTWRTRQVNPTDDDWAKLCPPKNPHLCCKLHQLQLGQTHLLCQSQSGRTRPTWTKHSTYVLQRPLPGGERMWWLRKQRV